MSKVFFYDKMNDEDAPRPLGYCWGIIERRIIHQEFEHGKLDLILDGLFEL